MIAEVQAYDQKTGAAVLTHALDYISQPQMMMTPEGPTVAGRTFIVMPFEHTLRPVTIFMHCDYICWLRDMDEKDQEVYSRAIEQTLARKEEEYRTKYGLIQLVPTLQGIHAPGRS